MKENIVTAEKKEHLFILDLDSGKIFEFNATAQFIIDSCVEKKSIEELVMEYAQFFETDRMKAEEDVLSLLKLLEENGLMEKL